MKSNPCISKSGVNVSNNRNLNVQKPNGENIYTSNKVEEVNNELLQRSLANYKDAENPALTGILPPIYNSYSVSSPINSVSITPSESFRKQKFLQTWDKTKKEQEGVLFLFL